MIWIHRNWDGLLLSVVATVVVSACSITPAPTVVPSPTAVPSEEATSTPSPTAATATPSPAPEPSPSPPPSATPTLAAPTPTPARAATATPVREAASPTPVADVRYGGTLNLVSRENIVHQDVHQDVSPALATWGPGIAYSRLMRFASGPGVELPSLAVECELCDGWSLLDETTLEFSLRNDVFWQDIQPVNGRKLDAEDIVFSYDRQRQQGFANAPLLHVMDTLEATAPDTVRISLQAPDADFIVSLADGHSKIVASEAVAMRGDLKDGPTIGTGPWIFTDTRPGVSHTFERNPDYFEEGLPFVEKLNIHIITDETTRRAAFRVQTTDVQQMEPKEWEEFRARQPDVSFLLAKEAAVGLEVAFKTTTPPFDDLRARKAALLAMDPWEAIEDVWLGAAYVSQGVPPLRADWLLTEGELGGYFDDPPQARQMLQDVGGSVPVTVRVGEFSDSVLAHAMRIADEMRQVGFEPEVEVVNRRRFGEEVWLGGNYQMFVGPVAPTTSPNGYLFPVLHSQGQWNTTEHRDDELDALIEMQAQEFDPIERRELFTEIQRHTLENAYRFMPATRVSIWTWWPRVQGFHPNFAGFEYSHWSRVWLK